MSIILLSRAFCIDGIRCTLTAGIRDGRALVVFGLPGADGLNELANITIEYRMATSANAIRFVEEATDETAARGLAKYRGEIQNVAERVNAALNKPFRMDKGYRSRGD